MENTHRLSFPILDDWSFVEKVRDEACEHIGSIIKNKKIVADSEAIIVELVENVVKYSDWNSPIKPYLQISISSDKKTITFTSMNAFSPESQHLSDVQKMVEFISDLDDGRDVYAEYIRQNQDKLSLSEGEEGAPSFLLQGGLLRIASLTQDRNGKCKIEAEVDDKSALHVTATMKL